MTQMSSVDSLYRHGRRSDVCGPWEPAPPECAVASPTGDVLVWVFGIERRRFQMMAFNLAGLTFACNTLCEDREHALRAARAAYAEATARADRLGPTGFRQFCKLQGHGRPNRRNARRHGSDGAPRPTTRFVGASPAQSEMLMDLLGHRRAEQAYFRF